MMNTNGIKMVISKNLLLLTLVMYSLCMMSDTLFILLCIKLVEIVWFQGFLYQFNEYIVQGGKYFIE